MMVLKKIKESVTDDVVTSTSLGSYLMTIKKAINDETTAIALYDEILKLRDLPASVRSVIEEIRDDEKDHLVILSELFNDEVEEVFDGFGDE